ncbi:YkgJ family cysteine cluster protein [Candidatus Falkowbacteria bacterium]|nr:YkgJ family cysteine cluster protein [Candidatus Falkowbacteria bacterium]
MNKNENPCFHNECGRFCCKPVKVRAFTQLDEKAKEKFKHIGRFARESCPDSYKLDFYSCKEFDEQTGKCKDYENRPDLCKNTKCGLFDCKNEEERKRLLKGHREKFYEIYEPKK